MDAGLRGGRRRPTARSRRRKSARRPSRRPRPRPHSAPSRSCRTCSSDSTRRLVRIRSSRCPEPAEEPIRHDEEPARRPDEAGAADAGEPEKGAGRARADRSRGPVGRRARQGRDDVQARREARDDRSFAHQRGQGHAGGPPRRRDQRRRAPGRARPRRRRWPASRWGCRCRPGSSFRFDGCRSDRRDSVDCSARARARCPVSTRWPRRCAACRASDPRPRSGWRFTCCSTIATERCGSRMRLLHAAEHVRHCERCNTFTEDAICALCRSAQARSGVAVRRRDAGRPADGREHAGLLRASISC